MRKAVVMLAAFAVLAFVNVGIYQREQLLSDGRIVLLELAPVDPRSLMQGDYMALRFKVAGDAFERTGKQQLQDGRIVAVLDARGVATFRRFDNGAPLAPDEVGLRYRVRNGTVKFATNAFFFQEGHAGMYERARYGEFRVAPDGDMILVAMRDAGYKRLGTPVASAS